MLTQSALLGLVCCCATSLAVALPSSSSRSTTSVDGAAFVSAWSGIRTGKGCGIEDGSRSAVRIVNRPFSAARGAPRGGNARPAGWATSRARSRPSRMVRMAADFYETLGVDRGCSKADLKAAFRKLARQYHPDVNDSPDAQDKFNKINQAYTVSFEFCCLWGRHDERTGRSGQGLFWFCVQCCNRQT